MRLSSTDYSGIQPTVPIDKLHIMQVFFLPFVSLYHVIINRMGFNLELFLCDLCSIADDSPLIIGENALSQQQFL